VFLDPIPSDLTPFYQGGYQDIPKSLSELRVLAARDHYRMRPILKYKKSGRLLDIGSWIGIFACNAKDSGFDVTTIEMDQDCVEFLNKTVGIRALQSSQPADALAKLDEKFDVITLWHSLEHLREPWVVIQEAAKHLAPRGILLVSLPNIESYQYARFKSAWRHLDSPRHLHFYPLESLAALCQTCGLSIAEATTSDEVSRVLSDDSWFSVAEAMLPIRYAREGLFHVLRLTAGRAEGRAGAGAGLTAVFELARSGDRLINEDITELAKPLSATG
jgi:2-polyprenyl-3-methyl-5-hydroxy-6-metoxy-1,4-benzoquinol methylase